MELGSQHIRYDHQPNHLAARSAVAPIVNSNLTPSPPHRLRSGGIALIQPGADAAEVPRQEFVDAFNGMIGDLCQHVAQVVLRVEAVQLGGFDQAVG